MNFLTLTHTAEALKILGTQGAVVREGFGLDCLHFVTLFTRCPAKEEKTNFGNREFPGLLKVDLHQPLGDN